MVNAKKIIVPACLLGTAVAQMNMIVNQATKTFVKLGTPFRLANVPEAQASSELSHLVNVPVNNPSVKHLINKAAGAVLRRHLDDATLSGLLNDGVQAYSDFVRSPQYGPYNQFVKGQVLRDFDLPRAEKAIMSEARPILAKVDGPLNSFIADPQGRRMGVTAVSLVKHIASDFGVEKYLTSVPEWQKYAGKLGA